MTDEEFLEAFARGRLARWEWTHEAHVRMAFLYFTRFGQHEALAKISAGIQHYNNLRGNPTGYHETITVAFCRLVASRLPGSGDWQAFRLENPDLLARDVLERHYSRDLLFSSKAKAEFVAPDRDLLPLNP